MYRFAMTAAKDSGGCSMFHLYSSEILCVEWLKMSLSTYSNNCASFHLNSFSHLFFLLCQKKGNQIAYANDLILSAPFLFSVFMNIKKKLLLKIYIFEP